MNNPIPTQNKDVDEEHKDYNGFGTLMPQIDFTPDQRQIMEDILNACSYIENTEVREYLLDNLQLHQAIVANYRDTVLSIVAETIAQRNAALRKAEESFEEGYEAGTEDGYGTGYETGWDEGVQYGEEAATDSFLFFGGLNDQMYDSITETLVNNGVSRDTAAEIADSFANDMVDKDTIRAFVDAVTQMKVDGDDQ